MGIPEMIEQRNRIMIYGPKADGTYVVEFRTASGEALVVSASRTSSTTPPRMFIAVLLARS
jgi:hypothetical protein